mmetsp:Transcript_20445/g.38883  ORF Transcript_20445/g.38883 Transcript_20445/m.38883 type:complete len:170 (-) Transcript_20445:49-558(-)
MDSPGSIYVHEDVMCNIASFIRDLNPLKRFTKAISMTAGYSNVLDQVRGVAVERLKMREYYILNSRVIECFDNDFVPFDESNGPYESIVPLCMLKLLCDPHHRDLLLARPEYVELLRERMHQYMRGSPERFVQNRRFVRELSIILYADDSNGMTISCVKNRLNTRYLMD